MEADKQAMILAMVGVGGTAVGAILTGTFKMAPRLAMAKLLRARQRKVDAETETLTAGMLRKELKEHTADIAELRQFNATLLEKIEECEADRRELHRLVQELNRQVSDLRKV